MLVDGIMVQEKNSPRKHSVLREKIVYITAEDTRREVSLKSHRRALRYHQHGFVTVLVSAEDRGL